VAERGDSSKRTDGSAPITLAAPGSTPTLPKPLCEVNRPRVGAFLYEAAGACADPHLRFGIGQALPVLRDCRGKL
jgi:hypothetical protein